MWFWWIMLVCNTLIPITMILVGWVMRKHPPKRINWVCGYRTALSMKNKETWEFAHEYGGRVWCIVGAIMLVPSIVAMVPFYHSAVPAVSIVSWAVTIVQLIALIASVLTIEIALKRTFDENGVRKKCNKS